MADAPISGSRRRRRRRRLTVVFGVLALLLIAAALIDDFIDPPARRWLESELNARLVGYAVTLDSVDFNPWNLSLDLNGLTIRQEAHPEPAVAHFPQLAFDVQWAALFRGRIVAECDVVRPKLHVDIRQLREESRDEVEFKDRGWQHAWEIYPLRVNRLRIIDGAATYIDKDPERPIRVSQADLEIDDIRHIRNPGKTYPSPIRGSAVLFGQGRMSLTGHTDLLLRPHPGIDATIDLAEVPLDKLGPVIRQYQVRMLGGYLAAHGQVEIAPKRYLANLDEVKVDRVRADYVAEPPTAQSEAARRQVEKAANYAAKSPQLRVQVNKIEVHGNLGYVNRRADPEYRIFLSDAVLTAENLANRADEGEARIFAKGLFMGSGRATLAGVFRAQSDTPDFALDLRVVDTELVTLNDALRSHANLDVKAGKLSTFMQVRVKDGQIRGYVKPLFSDVDIYDPEQDEEKNIFEKFYEAIAEGISNILENPRRDEVATVADVSGPVDDPDASTLQIIGNLLRNAFVEAILPGFEARGNTGRRERREG